MINHRINLILLGTTIKNALIQLDKLAEDAILFVVDESDQLRGSLTDGDIRRGLIKGVTIDKPIDLIIQVNPRYLKKKEYSIEEVIEFREKLFQIIPIVDDFNRIVNVINFRKVRSYLPIDAVLMAGGRGIRLKPLTDTKPKPLLKIGDKPIIEHNLDRLTLFGIDDFWISINYLGEQIENYFGDGSDRDIKINYVSEDRPMGTIGSVSKINNFQHDNILITNSDLLTNLDYEEFFLEFIKQDADLGVVTIPYNVNIPYAILEINLGMVMKLKEKPTYTYYANGGIYLVKRSVLDLIPKDQHFNATDLMEKLIENNGKVISYPLMNYWLDIGTPEDFEKAKVDILSIKF